jgi:hypothetical protein
MSQNGKGSARRGTSKEEMKRFEDNYDSIFRKNKISKKRAKVIVEKIEVIELLPEQEELANQLFEALRKLDLDSDTKASKKV